VIPNATAVKLGSTPALFSVVFDRKILTTVPTIPTGVYTWNVTTTAGTGTSRSAFVPRPLIKRFPPANKPRPPFL